MDTVQMYMAQFDKERILKTYYNRIKDEIDTSDDNISQHGPLYTYRNIIYNFIEKMAQIDITNQDPENRAIIIAFKQYDKNDFYEPSLRTSLIYEKDLRENKFNVTGYAYEFKPQSEIAGFYIANTKYVNDNIYEVLADILYEASFFGYDQERKEKVKVELNEAIEEIKNGNYTEKSFSDFKKEYEIPELTKDKKRKLRMEYECNSYLYNIELKKVMDLLNIEY